MITRATNTPKRHHAAPVKGESDKRKGIQSKIEGSYTSCTSSADSSASTPLEDAEKEKPVTDCDIVKTIIAPSVMKEPSSESEKSPELPLRQNATTATTVCSTKAVAICGTNGNSRNGLPLPKSGATVPNPSITRGKAASRSKRVRAI